MGSIDSRLQSPGNIAAGVLQHNDTIAELSKTVNINFLIIIFTGTGTCRVRSAGWLNSSFIFKRTSSH